MCRFIAFNTGKVDKSVISSLVQSAKSDPFSATGSHPDGWGAAAYIKRNSSWKLVYYKSEVPIYEDPFVNTVVSMLEEAEWSTGIIHARKAKKKFLLGVKFNHPYVYSDIQRDVFFAHNGAVRREAFGTPTAIATDSLLMFHEVIRQGLDEPKESLKLVMSRLRKYAISLNSSLMIGTSRDQPEVIVMSYYNSELSSHNPNYFPLYQRRGLVVSSTVAYYEKGEWTEIENGTVLGVSE